MLNQPKTSDLLTEARRVLMDSLISGLTGDQKYEALMVSNALGMAIRELEQRNQAESTTSEPVLSQFLAEHALKTTPDNAELDLARAIRQRKLPGDDARLRSLLRTLTEARLRINNPGYLK